MISFFQKKPTGPWFTTGEREEWTAAADRLLQGMFRHVKGRHAPLLFPRSEFAISYPQKDSPKRTVQAQRFEALARSFLLAAVRLRDNPELRFHRIALREYYAGQILGACRADGGLSVGRYDRLLAGEKNKGAVFQQTVEAGLLTIGLWASKEQIWDCYTREEKAQIIEFLEGYGYGNTVHQNWRMFNLLILTFLENMGIPQDREYIRTLLSEVLLDYAGDGWYRDGQHFDYYSCWAYQLFLPLICTWYAAEHEPALAQLVERHSAALMRTFPHFFDGEGNMLMWGRSGIYRSAAIAPLIGNLLLSVPVIDPGLARSLCTGAMAQFLNREDVLQDGVLTLGFYRQFPAMIQPYSCAESPCWMFLGFLCLLFGEDHPFWRSDLPERSAEGELCSSVLDAPGLCVTEHPRNASVILRSAKVEMPPDKARELWCYAKLCYHSQYPWESTLCDGREAMQYSLLDMETGKRQAVNRLLWHGEEAGVLYRKAMLHATPYTEWHWTNSLLLADLPVERGILRFDLLQLTDGAYRLSLGSFGFPYEPKDVQTLQWDNYKAMVIMGTDAVGRCHSMAFMVGRDWGAPELICSRGTSACAEKSWTMVTQWQSHRGSRSLPPLLISQVLTGDGGFPEEELFPLASVRQEAFPLCYTVERRDGKMIRIDFREKSYTL